MTWLLQKLSNLLDILRLPGGLVAKLQNPAFHQGDWQMCRTLAAMGVRPLTVVDVGANIGQFALAAAHMLRPQRLISLEPIPEVCAKLPSLRIPPGVKVQAVCTALGEVARDAEFRVMSQTASSSLLPLGPIHRDLYPEIREERTVRVAVQTLDHFISAHPFAKPSLLKLDVQGSELDVLRGCRRLKDHFEWILLETSTQPFYQGGAAFSEIHSHLCHQGYRWLGPVTIHQPMKIGPAESLQFDALYVSENAPAG